jgi:hypothetical protein
VAASGWRYEDHAMISSGFLHNALKKGAWLSSLEALFWLPYFGI